MPTILYLLTSPPPTPLAATRHPSPPRRHRRRLSPQARDLCTQAALGGNFEIALSEASRRLDGEATEATVRFKVGRKWKAEAFTLLALPELRGVLLVVLEQLQG